MADDIVFNKVQILERCRQRVLEEYDGNPENLKNFTKQDAIVLNIQRMCEAAIDLAMHLVAEKRLGIPQSSREAFDLLQDHGIVDQELTQQLKAMVGFRNIAVHDYRNLNLEIVEKIIELHLDQLVCFGKIILGG